jgi:hypothetical protein
MKIGIHQPYFFPYIGYFQLINAVDVYVCLDHVNYMKRSYMTRNSLINKISINIPVSGASQNKSCREVNVLVDQEWIKKFYKILEFTYKKEKNYETVINEVLKKGTDYINDLLIYKKQICISDFNFIFIHYICEYLDIKPRFYGSSGITDRKRNEGLQDIIKFHKGTEYINAIGGQALYTKEDFASQGIDLKFIKNKSEIGNTSILDLLFRFPKEYIQQELNNYELI